MPRPFLAVAVGAALTALTLLPAPANALWPMPRSLSTGNATLLLSRSFIIDIEGVTTPDLTRAIVRIQDQLKNDKLGRLVPGRGSSDEPTFSGAKTLGKILLKQTDGQPLVPIAQESTKEISARDESYSLTVPEDGSDATLVATTSLGLFRGLTTFAQLWYTYKEQVYALGLPIKINDKPAYPYRGFMLDTARNFYPIDDIKRTIDAMSWVKLNTLHWHVVDSQSFPIQVPAYPEISAHGAYGHDMVYKPTDVEDLVKFANERGVDIIPEFDTPGHTAIISESHPEHVACPVGNQPYMGSFANEPPQGQIRFAVPATAAFINEVIKSLASLFTSKYFSTGGDEINRRCYDDDKAFNDALASSGDSFEKALEKFTLSEHETLAGVGKSAVVWQEMVLDHQVPMKKDTIVMIWISSLDAAEVAQRGYRVVHSPSDYFYLDCGGGGWLSGSPNGQSWCDPFKTWQRIYSFNPLSNISSEHHPLILGGQGLLWSEQASPENLDPIVWPRAAGVAEVFWTGETLPDGTDRLGREALEGAFARIHDIRYRLVARGVRAVALQPLWCALRPGQC